MADRAGLLQAILYDLSLPHEGRSEQGLRLALIDHLVGRFAEGKRTLLVIDEAHHLGVDLLEELRLLGNLEGNAGKAMQVVLVGQPDLLHTLASPRLASLRQRLVVRPTIEPMGVEEAADYVLHHLRAAGGSPDEIVDGETLELVARAHRRRAPPAQPGDAPRPAPGRVGGMLRRRIGVRPGSARRVRPRRAGASRRSPARRTHHRDPRPTPASPVCRLFVAPARSA